MRRGPEGAQNGQPPKLRSRWSPGRPDFPARLGAAKSPGLADLPDLGLSRLPSLPLPPASASASTFARLEAPPDLRASTPSRQRGSRSDQSPLRIGRHPARVSSPLRISCAPAQDSVASALGGMKDSPRTRQSPHTLAAFQPWGSFAR